MNEIYKKYLRGLYTYEETAAQIMSVLGISSTLSSVTDYVMSIMSIKTSDDNKRFLLNALNTHNNRLRAEGFLMAIYNAKDALCDIRVIEEVGLYA